MLIFPFAGDESGVQGFKGVGDVFEEHQAEHNVFVFRRVYVVAQLVRSFEELIFKIARFFGVVFGRGLAVGQHGFSKMSARRGKAL